MTRSTVDLKVASLRADVLAAYAASHGVTLTTAPACLRCHCELVAGDTFDDCDRLCPQRTDVAEYHPETLDRYAV